MALIMPACKNWSSMMAVRFLMGMFEAIIVPGISLLIAGWYKKDEQPPRNALVFAAASSVVNGFLSWVIGHIPDSAPLSKWQYLYLLIGSISMIWSIFVFVFLPATPMEAKFLNKDEKVFWVQRLAGNKTGIENKVWKWDQALEAVIDPKTWIIFFFNIAINIPNGGLTTFSGIIIANLGFTPVNASLLSMPTGVMSTLSSFTFSMLAAKLSNRRCLVNIVACCVPIIGTGILYGVPRSAVGAQLVGLYLVYTYFGPYAVGISLAQANTAGHTKKSFSFAILYIGYAVGNLIGERSNRMRPKSQLTDCNRPPDLPRKPGAGIYWRRRGNVGLLLCLHLVDDCILALLPDSQPKGRRAGAITQPRGSGRSVPGHF